MVRRRFDSQLMDMKKRIIHMGEMVEVAIESAMTSLEKRDMDLAQEILQNDEKINALEREIEQLCTHLVATQQPFASDLRRIVAAYKIIASLERMGDLAVDTAKVSLRIGRVALVKPLIDLPKMAELVITMIKTAIDAYIEEDLDAARKLAELDHKVDHYYSLIFEELNVLMTENAGMAGQGVYLLLAARFLERIGDYCTNIGEEVIYMSLGVRENLNE